MKNWHGVWVATVTPFKNGALDVAAFENHIEWLISNGIHGLCPAGTTGEGSSLTEQEFETVVTASLRISKGRIPIVPGTGTNNTEKTIGRTKLAKKLGADGALVVTPYYVKPNADGLVRHYEMISEAADIPLMLYNVPGRTAVNMSPETVERIVSQANVAGVKECAPLPQVSELIERVGKKIQIFSGEDGVYVPFLSLGGNGIISVAANLIPDRWVEVYQLFAKGKVQEAASLFRKNAAFVESLFIESNPIPVKAGLEILGRMTGELRSPLAPISAKNRERLMQSMKEAGMEAGR